MVNLLLMALGCGSENNTVLTTNTTPVCDIDVGGGLNQNAWDNTVNNSLGIQAFDPAGHYIAMGAAERDRGALWPWSRSNLWYPVDGFKHPLCGTHLAFNRGYEVVPIWVDWDEADWVNPILPDAPFEFLIGDVEVVMGSTVYMEARIEPDNEFDDNFYPWWFSSLLTGAGSYNDWREAGGLKICTYGPWVSYIDWMDDWGDQDIWPWALGSPSSVKPEIHPSELIWWKEPPPAGYSDLSWLMLLQDDSTRFDDIDNFDFDDNPVPDGWHPWADNPRTGLFRIAFELTPNSFPSTVSTHHYEIGETAGWRVVTSEDPQAHKDSDDGKRHALEYNGEVVLRVDETQPNDDDIGVTFDVCRKAEGNSLLGYMNITSKVGIGDDIDGEGYHVIYVLRGEGPSPPVVAKSSSTPTLPQPPTASAPLPNILSETIQSSKPEASAWRSMVMAAGGSAGDSVSPAGLQRVSQYQLDVTPVNPSSKVTWSFEAVNLTTNTKVSVKVGGTISSTTVNVELLSGKIPNGEIKVTFPEQPANIITQLTATATITDTLGNTGKVSHRVWSHVLAGDQVKNQPAELMLPILARLSGVSDKDLMTASKLEKMPYDDPRINDPAFRQARILRLMAIYAAEDDAITVGELSHLIRSAQSFASSR